MENRLDKTAHKILLKRLNLVADIDAEDEAAVLELPVTVREFDAGIDIVSEGQYVSQCCILIDGFTYRYRHTLEGKRQIIAFHVSGDIPDLHSLHMNYMDHSFAATTRSRIGFVSHDAVWDLCIRRPKVAAALWRETLIDGAIFREWIVGLGRLSGHSRTAHLLCEIAMRMRAVGLAPDYVYRLPLTQHELADALGLTVVTVNRVLKDLRLNGVVDRERSRMTIREWKTLARLGEFDPRYLHFRVPITMMAEMPPEGA
ncbi:helix-turn-helix domain-containing protein [Jiella sp. 40Bstr34]|uniref:Helix-turn-helix domain-containing protein n=1 Tax=Jiella pacifica TaxID=2696469 RepID=A0A6N9SVR0_9HYPH|nr:helix-turn-helix domain-containing protein [Jiella pacifica]